jgi:hypothetical protein
LGLRPAAVEEDDFVEVGVAVDEAGAVRGDEPGDVGLREAAAEQVEDGERVDDVAQGAGLDDQDARRGAERGDALGEGRCRHVASYSRRSALHHFIPPHRLSGG